MEGVAVAVARERERVRGAGGFGRVLRGVIALLLRVYKWGRGRGSIRQGITRLVKPHLGGKTFALSELFDPFAKDVRNELFTHIGAKSSGLHRHRR